MVRNDPYLQGFENLAEFKPKKDAAAIANAETTPEPVTMDR